MSVIRYVANEATRFHTFVANRVSVIHEATDVNQWKYVDTKNNPADHASWGLSSSDLENKLWYKTQGISTALSQDDQVVKKIKVVTSTLIEEPGLMDRMLERYSNWIRLQKSVGWLLVFVSNLKMWVNRRKSLEMEISKDIHDQIKARSEVNRVINDQKWKTKSEKEAALKSVKLPLEILERAEMSIIRHVQSQHFGKELQMPTKPDTLQSKGLNRLSKFDPILNNGVKHVGGRSERATVSYEAKHPVIIPKESHIARLILEDVHKSVGHMGYNAVLSELRQKYWIPSIGSILKKVLFKCVTCRRYQARIGEQKMADDSKQMSLHLVVLG